MSRATSDVSRMLALVPWLLERPGASVDEAAAAFGVDASVIRTDLAHLDFCGLPGLGGGDLFEIDLVDDRVVIGMADELRRPLRPTPREALRLIVTVDAVADLLADDLPALPRALDKVRRALGIDASLADVVTETVPPVVAAMRQALRDERRVIVTYQGRNDATPRERTVDPWALHVEDGKWYLVGHDLTAGDSRTFRLDRASAVQVTEDDVVHPPPERLPLPRYRPSGDDLEVVLDVANHARWVLDAMDVDDVTERADGARVRVLTDAPIWIARIVLMAAGGVRVLAPDHVRALVLEMVDTALDPAATRRRDGAETS
ncbi:MAG: WYL domain-containing protein [Nitriliruptoraceae bacterium]